MAIYEGSCHCGGVTVAFETAVPPGDTPVRACQCSFCRKHDTRTVSDPEGQARFTERSAGALQRYRFGLGTADYIVCGRCGVYLGAAMTEDEGGGYAIVNSRALDNSSAFAGPAQPVVYDGESVEERIARRRARWTPLAR